MFDVKDTRERQTYKIIQRLLPAGGAVDKIAVAILFCNDINIYIYRSELPTFLFERLRRAAWVELVRRGEMVRYQGSFNTPPDDIKPDL